jgi:DNA-binding Lrp family transcriptional regulator
LGFAKIGAFMLHGKLSQIDLQILDVLQRRGRISNVQLAERVGRSAAHTLRHTQRLEKKGYIRSYHAKLNAQKLGFDVSAFVSVKLGSQAVRGLQAFEAFARSWPCVRECHALSGATDYLLKCVARDAQEFEEFFRALTASPDVESAKAAFCSRESKREAGLDLTALLVGAPARNCDG